MPCLIYCLHIGCYSCLSGALHSGCCWSARLSAVPGSAWAQRGCCRPHTVCGVTAFRRKQCEGSQFQGVVRRNYKRFPGKRSDAYHHNISVFGLIAEIGRVQLESLSSGLAAVVVGSVAVVARTLWATANILGVVAMHGGLQSHRGAIPAHAPFRSINSFGWLWDFIEQQVSMLTIMMLALKVVEIDIS